MDTEGKGIYLDNAATSYPKPECVYQAVDRFLRQCGGSPGRASHRKAREADAVVADARASVATLFHVEDPSRIVFTCNSTESLNLAIRGSLRPGDHVVLTDLEHNAAVRPLWKLREGLGVGLTVVESGPEGVVDPARVAEALTPRTRLVCCVHANNVLGTIQPIAEIGHRTRARGVPLLVDASQSAGVLPIDVEAMGIDLLAFTGHKGLLGPPGTGGLYVREGLPLEPLKHGGTGVYSESLEPPDVMPEGYEPGTFNTPGLAGLAAGVRFVLETGAARIGAHERELNRRFVEGVREVPGVRLYGPSDLARKVGITLLNLEALDPADVGRILDRRFGVMVRTGLHCSALSHQRLGTKGRGAVRFSFGHFTTPADVDTAVEALRAMALATVS
ncbi:MAG: aminotransferase class V-fold PLP-dependent enzyme [Planctomycetes bacterium]|nr:aminotransferase class V-fold PLP-dependent enzyme [Planctomycetota bacterium]